MTTARASFVFRSLVGFTSWSVIVWALLSSGAACESTTTPDDGGPPAPIFCKTDMDCPSGSNCSFEIDLGCDVTGECRILPSDPDADTTECAGQAGPACACDGTTIQVPPCWDFLAPKAVVSMGACGAPDAGAGG